CVSGIAAVFGGAPVPFGISITGQTNVLGLPGPRYIVIAPCAAADELHAALARHTSIADFEVWQWLTIRAGVPVVTVPTQAPSTARMVTWEVLGGIDFQKGCYTGQEIIARTGYLGRLKERAYLFHAAQAGARAGDRLFSVAFGEQPCGTVVNAARAP